MDRPRARGGTRSHHGSIAELRTRWHTGDRLVIGTANGTDSHFLGELDAVEAIESHEGTEIRLRLRSGAGISELLRAVGERMEVRYIRSEQTTLHEIYVRTVEADLSTPMPAEGEAS